MITYQCCLSKNINFTVQDIIFYYNILNNFILTCTIISWGYILFSWARALYYLSKGRRDLAIVENDKEEEKRSNKIWWASLLVTLLVFILSLTLYKDFDKTKLELS